MVKYYSICNRSYTRSVWDTMHNVLHKDLILYQSSAIIFYVLRSQNSNYEEECRNHNRNLRTHYVSLTKFINIPQPKPLDLKWSIIFSPLIIAKQLFNPYDFAKYNSCLILLTFNTCINNHTSITFMLPLALTCIQKTNELSENNAYWISEIHISNTRCFDKPLSRLLNLIHLCLR